MDLYSILIGATRQKTRAKCGEMLKLAIAPSGVTISQAAEVMQRDKSSTHRFLERLRLKRVLDRKRLNGEYYYQVSSKYSSEEVENAIEALGGTSIISDLQSKQDEVDPLQQQALDQILDRLPEFNEEWQSDVMIAYFQSLAAIAQSARHCK